jgi:hypothetical protein
MDVFVVPIRSGRYELYYEHDWGSDEDDGPSAGVLAAFQRRFSELVRAAEEYPRRRAEKKEAPASWMGRLQDRLFLWIAERIADQRLLWNLRKQTAAIAVHPAAVSLEDILPEIRRALQRDFDRHRFWLIIDGIGLVIAAAFTVIPGPNLLSYYFVFRVGGHWLSMRGARRGRYVIQWTGRPCQPLDRLRALASADPSSRRPEVQAVGSELGLRNLAVFFDRVTGS